MADRNWPVTRIPSIFDSDDDSDEEVSRLSPDQSEAQESTVFIEKEQADFKTTDNENIVKNDTIKEHIDKTNPEEEELENINDDKGSKKENNGQENIPSNNDAHSLAKQENTEPNAEVYSDAESIEKDHSEQVTEKVTLDEPETNEGKSNVADLDKESLSPEGSEGKDDMDDDLDKSFSSFDNVEEGSDSDEGDKINQSTSSHDNVDEGSEDTVAGADKSFSSHDNVEEGSEEEDMEVNKSTLSHDNVDEASEDEDVEVDKSTLSNDNVDEEGTALGMNRSGSSHDCTDEEGIATGIDKSGSSHDCTDEESIAIGIDKSGSSHDCTDEEVTAMGMDKSGSSHDCTDEEVGAVRIDRSNGNKDDESMAIDKSELNHDHPDEEVAVGIDRSGSSLDNTDEASEEGADMDFDKSISSHGNADEVSDEDEGDAVLDKSISSQDNEGSDDNEGKNNSAAGDNELDISLFSQGNADEPSDNEVNDGHTGFESEGEKKENMDAEDATEKIATQPNVLIEKDDSITKCEDVPVEVEETEQPDGNGDKSSKVQSPKKSDCTASTSIIDKGGDAAASDKEEEDNEKEIKSEIKEEPDDINPTIKDGIPTSEDEEKMEVEKVPHILDKENTSDDEMETNEQESNLYNAKEIIEQEPFDKKEDYKSIEEARCLTEMEKKEVKQKQGSPKWDPSLEDSESRDSDTQAVMKEKKEEPIYSDSETEDTMDMELENEPKRSTASSSVGRIPVRVEDVYTDSEDEGTRDSQVPGGKRCEISVTSETDSVDPEEQKDTFSVPPSPLSTTQGCSGDAPHLATFEALPSSDTQCMMPTKTPDISEERSRKRRHASKKSFNMEACLKAFEQGWKREIVFRATVDPNKGATRADIYYYAPFGKKLRSKVEIEDYLQRYGIQDLTLENFTWVKVPLGVSEEHEQIRHASKSASFSVRGKSSTPSQTGTSTPVVTPVSSPKTPASVEVKGPRKRGRPPKQQTENPPKRARMKITPIIPLNLKKHPDNKKNISPQPATSVSKTSTITNQSDPSSEWNSNINVPSTSQAGESVPAKGSISSKSRQNHIVYSTKICESLTSAKILTPMLSGDATLRTFHCTNVCPLGAGMVPSLQCIKCLCLFHPECTLMPPAAANIVQTGNAKFLCPNCYRENKENVGANQWTAPKPYEPLAYDPPCWEEEDEEDNKPDKEVIAQNYVRVSLKDSFLTSHSASSIGVASHSRHSGSVSQGAPVTLYSTAGSSVQTQSSVFTSDSQANGLPASVSGVIGGLPPNLPNGQLVQIQSPGSVPTRFLLVRTNLGAEMQPVPQAPQMGVPRGLILPTNLMPGQSMPFMVRPQGPHLTQSGYQGPTVSSQVSKPDFLRELSQSYRLLLRVFKYLSVKDLLIASRVCVMWRDLAYSSSLWTTVRLRNVCVGDWSQFAKFLERRNTLHIDLRKMIIRHVPVRAQHQEGSIVTHKDKPSPTSKSSHLSDKYGSKSGSPVKDKSEQSDVKKLTNSDERDHKGQESSEHCSSKKPENSSESQPDTTTNEKNKSLENLPSDKEKHAYEGKDEGMEVAEEDSKDFSKEIIEKEEAMEVDNEDTRKKESASYVGSNSDKKESSLTPDSLENQNKTQDLLSRSEGGTRRNEDMWDDICGALGSIHCLRGVTLPTCRAEVLQLLLTRCRNLTSVTAIDLREPSGISKFDPAFLMEVPQLEELRLGSPQTFSLTSNFNFIKLQQLKVLVMRGFSGLSWPYLGTSLTSLQAGPISNFTNQTWNNIGSMASLEALWLEDGGSLNDFAVYEALSHLYNLKRLCLFNFVVGPKLGQALKKINKLERLFILTHSSSQQANISVQNSNLLAIAETMRHVNEFVWAIRSQDIHIINQVEHVQMCPTKSKDYAGLSRNDDTGHTDMWTLQQLEALVKRHLPRTKVRILKLDAAAASRMAMSTL